MTGEENYKEFDTASIVTRDTVSLGKYTFRKRDILLGGIALIALLTVIILAIVLAVEVRGKKSESAQVNSNQEQQQQQQGNNNNTAPSTGAPVKTDYCSTPICLRTASYQKTIMDESANPCVDFYKYACGKYATTYPQDPFNEDQTPYNQIWAENFNKLLNLLDYPVDRSGERSYERKLKHFMLSCTSHFDKMGLSGKPMIEKIIQPYGGWYVFGQWDPKTFNLHTQLKKAHIDFWTAVFFKVTLTSNTNDWRNKIIELGPAGLGMDRFYYGNFSYLTRPQMQYRNYLTLVANYLSNDANVEPNEARIEQFVNDVVTIETELAEAMMTLQIEWNPHDTEKQMTLGQLNQLINNTLDLVDYFQSAFPSLTNYFSINTPVAILQTGFFHWLGSTLNQYNTEEGKRMLHNYMLWQVINRYVEDLSWEYVHLKRDFVYQTTGVKDDSSGYRRCLMQAEYTMPDALNALFIKSFAKVQDKNEAEDMLTILLDELVKGVRSASWMTDDNKDQAVKKLQESMRKIGYPEYMVNDTMMDAEYEMVSINDSEFLSNVLNLNKAVRKQVADYLVRPALKPYWPYHIFDPQIRYINSWHEFIVTSAALQSPVFAHDGPIYFNFGGTGSLMSATLINAINDVGASYLLDKSNYGTWWSTTTQQRYSEKKQCAINAQKNAKLGPFTNVPFQINMTVHAAQFASQLLADTSGVRLALRAYKQKLAKSGNEKLPATFETSSPEKMFFLAYAQTYCQNTDDFTKWMHLNILRYPGDYRVNLAVSQLSEFREAYQCRAGDPLVPEATCNLF